MIRRAVFSVCLLSLCLAGPVVAQDRSWPSERPPRPLAAREIKFPPYEIRTLPNGLQVVAVLHHEQPAVSMRLLIRTGTASDPVGKLGLVHLLSSLLDQGTTTKSAQELADAVDFIGAAKNTGAGTDLSFINAANPGTTGAGITPSASAQTSAQQCAVVYSNTYTNGKDAYDLCVDFMSQAAEF